LNSLCNSAVLSNRIDGLRSGTLQAFRVRFMLRLKPRSNHLPPINPRVLRRILGAERLFGGLTFFSQSHSAELRPHRKTLSAHGVGNAQTKKFGQLNRIVGRHVNYRGIGAGHDSTCLNPPGCDRRIAVINGLRSLYEFYRLNKTGKDFDSWERIWVYLAPSHCKL